MQKEKCPYCKGSKFIYIGCEQKEDNGKRRMYPQAATCYCVLNKQVNIAFPIFSSMPVVPPDDIKEVYRRYPLIDKKGRAISYLFMGDEKRFIYISKAFFIGEFSTKNYLILEGRQIVEKYHVPKKDEWLTIEQLNSPDLLVLFFTSHVGYATLESCVLDVIKNRARLNLSTWIYSRDELAFKSSPEYSADLDSYLESYKKISLDIDYRFKGYNPVESTKTALKQEQKLNDSLGDM